MLLNFLLPLGLAVVASADVSSFSQKVCFTSTGASSVSPVPTGTTTYAKTFSVNVKSTSTKTSTVTPPPATVTSTSVAKTTVTTTVYQTTDTFTTTSTSVYSSVSTVRTTTTSTIYKISTYTSRDYVTTATPAGYTPLSVQLAASGYNPAKRDLSAEIKREAEAMPAAASSPKSRYSSVKAYPTAVKCTQFVEVVTVSTSVVTASSTKTTTAPKSTSTVVTSTTLTITSTVNGGKASTTVTSVYTTTVPGSTYTIQSYDSVTSSSTTTVYAGTATIAPICNDPANFVTSINGSAISGSYGFGGAYSEDYKSPEECCLACQLAGARCGESYYRKYPSPNIYTGAVGACVFGGSNEDGETCNPAQSVQNLVTDTRDQGGVITTANNGVCGHYSWDPSDARS